MTNNQHCPSESRPEDAEAVPTSWAGDALDRKPYADFLTSYIKRKSKRHDKNEFRPFTIAIDDEWGRGKTFFVKNWIEDLHADTPPTKTIYFDAWAADCVSDPLLSFMSELLTEIDKSIALVDQARHEVKELKGNVRLAFVKMGAAIVPASKVVFSGILKKTIGAGLEEISEAISSEPNELEGKSEGSITTPAIDKIFDAALKEQSDKRRIIEEFKVEISAALKLLEQEGAFQLPVFVFVDELDRSRPDFSIQLLEGIKHLFDISGLCFVVSTNVDQLSQSIKGGYGAEFDGKKYLDRLFDVRYTLPRPTTEQYANKLVADWNIDSRKVNYGVPRSQGAFRVHPNPASVLNWIGEVFDLDLRSLEKVFNLIVDAADGLPKKYELQFLWMGFLAAVKHKFPDQFSFIEASPMSQTSIVELFDALTLRDDPIKVLMSGRGRNSSVTELTMRKSVEPYLRWHKKSSREIFDYVNVEQGEKFIGGQLEFISREFHNGGFVVGVTASQNPNSSIASYFTLIRNAGFLEHFS